jgi:hypothetical protein
MSEVRNESGAFGKMTKPQIRMTNVETAVAQIGNLLYRRLAVGESVNLCMAADCQSATRQTASLRYNKFPCSRAS